MAINNSLNKHQETTKKGNNLAQNQAPYFELNGERNRERLQEGKGVLGPVSL